MSNNSLKAIHLRFTSPLHLGSKKADYGQSEMQLHSDTLYSAIFQVWSMVGKAEWIPTTENPGLGFALSSAFPYFYQNDAYTYFFPKPFAPVFHRNPQKEIAGTARKRVKKLAYLDQSAFDDWRKNGEIDLDLKKVKGAFYAETDLPKNKDGSFKNLIRSQVTPRVKVSRIDGEDATPYYIDKLYFYEGKNAHSGLYFLFQGDEKELNRLKVALEILQDEGLGTDRKIGHGQFEYTISEYEPQNIQGTAAINLSLYLPDSKETLKNQLLNVQNGGYTLMERTGWITTPPLHTFRKNRIYFIGEGSIVKQESNTVTTAGKLVDLYPKSLEEQLEKPHPVWRVGKSILFPVKL